MAIASANWGRQPGGNPTFSILSAIPGRVRLQLKDRTKSYERLHRWADWLHTYSVFTHIDIAPDAGSLTLHYDAHRLTLDSVLDSAAAAANQSARSKPPKTPSNISPGSNHAARHHHKDSAVENAAVAHVRAKDMHHAAPVSLQRMIFPTVAAILAAVEATPAILVVAAIAVSAAPTAKRALHDAKVRRFTIDELDLLNVTLAVYDGALLPAAAISWLTNLGELLRARAITTTKDLHLATQSTALQKWTVDQHAATKLLLEDALLTDTQFQGISTRFHAGAMAPFVGLAGVISLTTSDLGFIVGVLKPLYDFAGSVRFGVPAILLNAMSQTARHGPIFRSARAVENLAKVDAIVFFTMKGMKGEKTLVKRIRQLISRGVNHFILPTAALAASVEKIADSVGKDHVVAEVIPNNPAYAVELLHRHGHTVAVVEDGKQEESWFHRADVRIALPGAGVLSERADIVMAHPDLRGIGRTIDQSHHAMALTRQNLIVAGLASGVNLSFAFLPPLLASTVSTVTTAILASNIVRELDHDPDDDNELEISQADTTEVTDEANLRSS